MWLSALVFTSSVHLSIHLSPPVIFPHTLQLLFPFFSLPNGSTSSSAVPTNTIIFPTCFETWFFPPLHLDEAFPPSPHLPFFHPVIYLVLVSFLVTLSSALRLSFYSYSPLSIIHSYPDIFFPLSNFVTVSTHPTVLIFLSHGRVIFLIFSSPNIPLCHYSPLLLLPLYLHVVEEGKRYCRPIQ